MLEKLKTHNADLRSNSRTFNVNVTPKISLPSGSLSKTC